MDEYPPGFEPETPATMSVLQGAKLFAEEELGRPPCKGGFIYKVDPHDAPSLIALDIDMEDDEEKDKACLAIFATLAAERAVEAAFISAVWMVRRVKLDGVVPSEQPDRQSALMIHHVSPDGEAMHFAAVEDYGDNLRSRQVGPWTSMKADMNRTEGRWRFAMVHGIHVGKTLPPEMVAYIEQQRQAGKFDDIVGAFMRQQQKVMIDHAKRMAGDD